MTKCAKFCKNCQDKGCKILSVENFDGMLYPSNFEDKRLIAPTLSVLS